LHADGRSYPTLGFFIVAFSTAIRATIDVGFPTAIQFVRYHASKFSAHEHTCMEARWQPENKKLIAGSGIIE